MEVIVAYTIEIMCSGLFSLHMQARTVNPATVNDKEIVFKLEDVEFRFPKTYCQLRQDPLKASK